MLSQRGPSAPAAPGASGAGGPGPAWTEDEPPPPGEEQWRPRALMYSPPRAGLGLQLRTAGDGGGSSSSSSALGQLFDMARRFTAALEADLACGPTAARIRTALAAPPPAHPGGLTLSLGSSPSFAAAIASIPLSSLFAPGRVEHICATADGIQPFLIAPEKGLRRLVSEAIGHAADPAQRCVDTVHSLLREAVASAAAAAATGAGAAGAIVPIGGGLTEVSPLTDAAPFDRLPGGRIMAAMEAVAGSLLSRWRREASALAAALVAMEVEVIDARQFRALSTELRAGASAAAAPSATVSATAAAGSKAGPRAPSPGGGGGSEGSSAGGVLTSVGSAPAAGLPGGALDARRPRGPGYRRIAAAADGVDPRAYLMGTLDKGAREGEGPFRPRWVVLSERSGRLYYYSSAAAASGPPGGTVDLAGCRAVILHSKEALKAERAHHSGGGGGGGGGLGGLTRSEAKNWSSAASEAGSSASGETVSVGGPGGSFAAGTTFAVTAVNRSGPVVKNHGCLVLRAPSMEEAEEWVARVNFVAEARGSGPAGAAGGHGGTSAGAGAHGAAHPATSPAAAASMLPADRDAAAAGAAAALTATTAPLSGPVLTPGSLVDMGAAAHAYAERALQGLARAVPQAVILALVARARRDLPQEMYLAVGSADAEDLRSLGGSDARPGLAWNAAAAPARRGVGRGPTPRVIERRAEEEKEEEAAQLEAAEAALPRFEPELIPPEGKVGSADWSPAPPARARRGGAAPGGSGAAAAAEVRDSADDASGRMPRAYAITPRRLLLPGQVEEEQAPGGDSAYEAAAAAASTAAGDSDGHSGAGDDDRSLTLTGAAARPGGSLRARAAAVAAAAAARGAGSPEPTLPWRADGEGTTPPAAPTKPSVRIARDVPVPDSPLWASERARAQAAAAVAGTPPMPQTPATGPASPAPGPATADASAGTSPSAASPPATASRAVRAPMIAVPKPAAAHPGPSAGWPSSPAPVASPASASVIGSPPAGLPPLLPTAGWVAFESPVTPAMGPPRPLRGAGATTVTPTTASPPGKAGRGAAVDGPSPGPVDTQPVNNGGRFVELLPSEFKAAAARRPARAPPPPPPGGR